MSTNLNGLTEKVGEVNRAAAAMMSNANAAMDGVAQTIYRQKHIESLMAKIRSGEIGLSQCVGELEVIAGRCPSTSSMEGYLSEHHRQVGIVTREFSELYEAVEKLRGLEAASVDPDGEPTDQV